MITAIIFIIILLILILIHELGHFLAAKKQGVYVEEFGFGFPPRLIGKKIGETLYSLNAIPIGGFVKLFGEEYHEEKKSKLKNKVPASRAFINKKPWQKTIILLGGVFMNFVLGWVLISYLFTAGVPEPKGISVVEVQVGTPAKSAGIMPADKIVSYSAGGKTTALVNTFDLVTASQKYADQAITLQIDRSGQSLQITVVPRSNPPTGQGALGIVLEQIVTTKIYPWYSAPFYGLVEAFSMTGRILVEIAKLPVQIIMTQKTNVEFAGPLGIAKVVGQAREYGYLAILELTALLSLNLAVFNILPFPALDGGRLVFVIYEWITKKKPNEKLERNLNFVGIVVLLTFSVLVTIKDIQKIWG